MLSTLNLTVTTLSDPSGLAGTVSLRQAITTANADTIDSQEIISFASGLSGTINLTEALPSLSNNISITGPGASSLTVNRLSTDANFSIFTVNSGETVNISGITIEGGNATNGGGINDNSNGAPDTGGTLTVNSTTFTGNNASESGGGISNNGMLTVTNSTFTGNNASEGGGGIYNGGYTTVTVTNSTFANNNGGDGGGDEGGGIFNNMYGYLTVTNSTFTNNFAGGIGGGIFCNTGNGSGFGTLTIVNSTFTDNTASEGGGIWTNGPLTVVNSTFTDNTAFASNSDVCGGIVNNSGELTVTNTIVAGNTGNDIDGPVQTTSSYNLIGNCNGITNLSYLNSTNYIGTTSSPINPDLGPLQNNGGPTETMALLPGSPAIGTGSVTLAVNQNGNPLATDQRGAGYPRTVNGTVDIGAYEHSPIQTITFGPLANQTYGAYMIVLNATDTSDLPITYNVVSGPATFLEPSDNILIITGLGVVTVAASQSGNIEYNPATPVDESFTIAQATPTMSVVDNGGTYNGTAFTATATVNGQSSLEGVTPTLDYQQYINGAWTDLGANAPINAGSYDATANFAGSADYAAASSPTVDFNITPPTATILVTPTPRLIYNGDPQVTATGTATGGSGVNLNSDLTINSTHTNAGSYPDTWSFTDPTGYYVPAQGTMTDTIGMATATIFVTPTPGLIYNGGPQVTATGTATGVGGVNLSGDLTINSTHTNAGSYSDTWSFTDPTGNYAPETGAMTDTIAQATATVMVTSISGLVYNGSPQQTASYSATGVNGALPSTDFTDTTVHTNAGTYYDTWTFTDPNYVSQTGSVTDHIVQATATVVVTPTPRLVYNGGSQQTASYSATGVGGVSLPSTDFTDTTVHANAGTYHDTWTFTDPTYVSQIGSVTDNIAQATATILVTPTPKLIYNGGPQVTATGTATGVGGVNLSSDLTINSTHTNAGSYSDT